MNERINALLIEAHRQTEGGIYNGHLSVWTEKFAQLIVAECAAEADKCAERGSWMAGYRIKQHFGVEE
jgi:hypothetical protein